MIAKITKGSCFRGVVNYILDKEKDAKIFVCDGLFAEDKDTIAMSFEAQSKMNPKALEYLKEMGITDTQVLIVRHFDKEHPHVHIAFN